MGIAPPDEIEFVAQQIVEKVFQGNQEKLGLARHCAGTAIVALQDYSWIMCVRKHEAITAGQK